MAPTQLLLTAANMIKLSITPPRLTDREIADDLLSFAKVLPRRWVHKKPTGRKAVELPPSVQLPLFVFVERTEAGRDIQQDTKLTFFTQTGKLRGRLGNRIKNLAVNREIYIKDLEVEETKRTMSQDVAHYLHDCVHGQELDLLDARLQAAAEEIQEHISEIETDEKTQRLETRLSKSGSDIGRRIEKDEKNPEE